MNWLLISLLVLIFAAGIWTAIIWQKINHSISISKPLIANTKSFEQHPANPNLRILVAGDSIGVGVGAANNTDSLAGRIGHSFPNADITNIAVSGAKLADLEKKLTSVENSHFDIVLLQIGANDITGGTSYSEVEKTLSRILDRAGTLGKKVIVLTAGNVGLSPAFLWPFSEYISWRTREMRNIFMAEVLKHPSTMYVDLFRERKDEIFNTDIPRYYAPDLFHPSGDGYGVWYSSLKALL